MTIRVTAWVKIPTIADLDRKVMRMARAAQ
jgi:hypothetical protein